MTSHALLRPGNLTAVLNDRVLMLMALIMAILLLLAPPQALKTLVFTGKALVHIAPFFILAIAFAAYAKASGADQVIARAFSVNTALAILAGSLAGALSPFCSCGVVPIIAGMLVSGVPLAPVMAFCIASPIMDPEMFILTAAGIHLQFAVAKTITAMGMGLLAGYVIWGLQQMGYLQQPLRQAISCGCGQPAFDPRAPIRIAWRFWREPDRVTDFASQFRTNALFLAKWMILAFMLESLMVAYLPADTVARFVGMDSWMAIPAAAIIGIPAYMNGYAAIPLISGLLELGMAPGAALSFVTAGAVSSIPAAMAVSALVRRSVFGMYICLGVIGSVLSGYAYAILLRM